MKLVSCNIWCGTVFEPLMEFVKAQSADTDIFCFQEVLANDAGKITQDDTRANLLKELQAALPDFEAHFAPVQEGYTMAIERVDYALQFGNVLFLRNTLDVSHVEEFFVYRERNAASSDNPAFGRNVQQVTVATEGKHFTIFNFHGLWVPGGKQDNEARIQQARLIRWRLDAIQSEKILCGDFNLLPDNPSLATLESGLRNLIKEYGITDTRGDLYEFEERFADYTLVSPGVTVEKFEVPRLAISDHLPMILEFS